MASRDDRVPPPSRCLYVVCASGSLRSPWEDSTVDKLQSVFHDTQKRATATCDSSLSTSTRSGRQHWMTVLPSSGRHCLPKCAPTTCQDHGGGCGHEEGREGGDRCRSGQGKTNQASHQATEVQATAHSWPQPRDHLPLHPPAQQFSVPRAVGVANPQPSTHLPAQGNAGQSHGTTASQERPNSTPPHHTPHSVLPCIPPSRVT